MCGGGRLSLILILPVTFGVANWTELSEVPCNGCLIGPKSFGSTKFPLQHIKSPMIFFQESFSSIFHEWPSIDPWEPWRAALFCRVVC